MNIKKYWYAQNNFRVGFRNTSLKYRSIKQTLNRQKNIRHPRIPDSISAIRDEFSKPDIIEKYGYTLDGDTRFYIDTVVEHDFAFTIFASKYVIDFIENKIDPKSRNYLMDGTFNSLPSEFYQLLIISIEYQNDVSKYIACLLVRPSVRPSARPSIRFFRMSVCLYICLFKLVAVSYLLLRKF